MQQESIFARRKRLGKRKGLDCSVPTAEKQTVNVQVLPVKQPQVPDENEKKSKLDYLKSMYGEQEVLPNPEKDNDAAEIPADEADPATALQFGQDWNPNELKMLERVKNNKR